MKRNFILTLDFPARCFTFLRQFVDLCGWVKLVFYDDYFDDAVWGPEIHPIALAEISVLDKDTFQSASLRAYVFIE